jgi:HK97 gp10 family phage protein
MSNVRVKGLSELNAALQTLPAKIEANVLRSAMRAGANVIKDEAKANVPVATGTLKAGIKVSTSNRRGTVTAKVKTTGKHAYIAKWLEYGTAAHRIVSKGKGLNIGGVVVRSVDHPGISPRPFLRPALDSKAQQAVVAVGNAIKKRLATKHGIDTADIEVEAE